MVPDFKEQITFILQTCIQRIKNGADFTTPFTKLVQPWHQNLTRIFQLRKFLNNVPHAHIRQKPKQCISKKQIKQNKQKTVHQNQVGFIPGIVLVIIQKSIIAIYHILIG